MLRAQSAIATAAGRPLLDLTRDDALELVLLLLERPHARRRAADLTVSAFVTLNHPNFVGIGPDEIDLREPSSQDRVPRPISATGAP